MTTNFLKLNVVNHINENEKHFVEVFFKFFLNKDFKEGKFMDLLIFITVQPNLGETFRSTAIFRKVIKIFKEYFLQEDPAYSKIFDTL